MKKFTALFLVVSLMMLSVNLYAKERRGAKLIITKKDGRQISGELITVKPNSLLLLDRESGADVSVDIGDIKFIKILKQSKARKGALLGGLIGGLSGALVVAIAYEEPYTDAGVGVGIIYGLIFGAIGGGIGALTGGIIGGVAGIDETFRIEQKHPAEIEKILAYLHKKARIRDYK